MCVAGRSNRESVENGNLRQEARTVTATTHYTTTVTTKKKEKTKCEKPNPIHMPNRKRLPPIDAQLKERFKDDVKKRRGSVNGHFRTEVERALEEYLNATKGGDTHDRLRRIENTLDDLSEQLDLDNSQSDSDSRTDSVTKTTEKRVDKIMADIQDRAKQLDTSRVREEDVEAAIERNAGTSYKTIQRYKRLLQNQKEIFAHPTVGDVFFVKATAFIASMEQSDEIPEHKKNEVAEKLGWNWWEENAPEGLIDSGGKGFQ